MVVADDALVDVDKLRVAQVAGAVKVGEGTWHLVVGQNAGQYAAEINGQRAGVLS